MSDTIYARFGRHFAPAPEIHVFADVDGLAYDAVRDPVTLRPIIGLSAKLFHSIRNDLLERQNRQIANEFEIRYVRGQDETIAFRLPSDPVVADADVPSYAAPTVVDCQLRPKPI